VALTPAGEVVLVRQFREAVRRPLLEIPAGIRDVPGEPAARCAARELLEETGYAATGVEPLASILTSPGFADERIELFVAEASEGPAAQPTEPEVETVVMPIADAIAAVLDGAIVDAKTVAALLLAERRSRA
jgi:8-oxo-dGTP pyrophosphatase MutT (NUDIX family)